ncbi:MAG TPA: PsbP-related protein [Syntrophales bacterium]|nr:PsbP-related protein [Syntrophales bacterium]HOX93738.1 PsbP-related protein [Syntrophales bacterium]HPI57084.1 PsbP-related protein [Syntrophales bacterium]HPN23786.1 PsbP-related protein [Syntrophales bacterium]HQM30143.1 PsbP-related protein [Syntrophales bacterium]
MGFFDKVLGRKEEVLDKGWQACEKAAFGFRFSCPSQWVVTDIDGGIELSPPAAARVPDVVRGKETSSPGVTINVSDLRDPGPTAVKDTVKTRSTEFPEYRFVKHISSSVRNADKAAVYEFQYGSGENAFSAISAIAFAKNKLFILTACGRRKDFDQSRDTLEKIVAGFQMI